MLFQKTQMCFNEPDFVMVHTVMNLVTANGAKMTQIAAIMFLSYYYLALVGKGLCKHTMLQFG